MSRKEGPSLGTARAAWGYECRYKEKCNADGCPYNHSKRQMCRDEGTCKRKGCWYNHPRIVENKKYMTKQNGCDKAGRVQVKCKYGNLCKTKTSCVYNHPGRLECRNGDECWLRSCWYNHSKPICKFRNCKRKDTSNSCPYRHPARGQTDSDSDDDDEDDDDTETDSSESEGEKCDLPSPESSCSSKEERAKDNYNVPKNVNVIKNSKDKKEAIGDRNSQPVVEKDKIEKTGNNSRQYHQMKVETLPILQEKLKALGVTQENKSASDSDKLRQGQSYMSKMGNSINNHCAVAFDVGHLSNAVDPSTPLDLSLPKMNQGNKKRFSAQNRNSQMKFTNKNSPFQESQVKTDNFGNGYKNKCTKQDAKYKKPIIQIRIPQLNLSNEGLLPTPQSLFGPIPYAPQPTHYPVLSMQGNKQVKIPIGNSFKKNRSTCDKFK